jgi:hypothetical protein
MDISITSGGLTSFAHYCKRTTLSAAGQSLTANTELTVSLDYEIIDPDGIASVAANQITLVASGKHYISAGVLVYLAAQGDEAYAYWYDVTGSSVVGFPKKCIGSGAQPFQMIEPWAWVNPVSANNVYEVRVVGATAGAVGRSTNPCTLATANLDFRNPVFVGKK